MNRDTESNFMPPAISFADENKSLEIRDLATRIKSERNGRLPNLYRMLLHSPQTADGWLRLLTAVRQKCDLSAALRELAILRVALLNRSRPEFDAHVNFATQSGVSREKIEALAEWKVAEIFVPEERALLAMVDAMTLHIQVPDEVLNELGRHFDDREIVEIVVTISAYNMTTRFLEALRIDQPTA